MQNFLDDVVEKLLHQYNDRLDKVTVVFPNRRAGIFFRDALAGKIDRPLLSPQILTFEDFIYQLSTKKCADKLTLVYILFDVFKEQTGIRESFDRFYHWGEMLLHDFDEIDHWQVNAEDLFSNIHDLKELEAHFDYLSAEQIAAIVRFWKSFSPAGGERSSTQEQFIGLWSKLHGVYEAFRQRLAENDIAYPGMIAREIATLADEHRMEDDHSPLVFVGLNAFTRTEEKIVSWFVKEKQANVYWDVDVLYVEDRQQEAGTFFRKYQQHPVLSGTFELPLPAHFTQGRSKNMQLIATTLEVGQAKKLGELLSQLAQQPGFNPEKTVVVLPDDQLLFPVLHSIPASIRRINVTMGYPLQKTSLYSLMSALFTLQEEKKYDENRRAFAYYHSSVISILKHPYLVQSNPALSAKNVQKLMKDNRVYMRATELTGGHPLYPLIFRPVEAMEDMFTYLQAILLKINELIQEQENQAKEGVVESNETEVDEEEQELKLPDLEQELIYHFYLSLNRLEAIVSEQDWHLSLPVFFRFFKQVMESLKVPFTGEPLRGLQVMGVLETRNLDFEHVFFLSMNESIYPPSETNSSFVPGSLRKGFGLPSQDHQDMLYAYAFFRLLQKAKNVYCFYNTEDTLRLSGEPSRFLYQLMYESDRMEDGRLRFPRGQGKLMIEQRIMAIPVHAIPAPRLTIEKSPEVRKSMARFIRDGSETPVQLSPSALNTYLDCRLKFYFKYVAEMQEADILQEEIDPAVFGNILHKTMELAYTKYQELKGSAVVETDAVKVIAGKYLDEAMEKAFCEHFRVEQGQSFSFEGKNLIVREIIRKMAIRILELDAQYAPFEIIGLEKKNYLYNLLVYDAQGEPFTVSLKGIVDRIDRKGSMVRVLDYKTGRDEKDMPDIASLFDRENPKRNKAAMQAFFYALLYEENEHQQQGHAATQIIPGLINAKNIFQEPFDPRFTMSRQLVNHFTIHREAFVKELSKLIREIFDAHVPFDQTSDQKKCSYCPYASICF